MTDEQLALAITGALREMRAYYDQADIDAALDHGTLMLQQLLGVDRVFIMLLSDDQKYVTINHASGGVNQDFIGQKIEFAKLPTLTVEAMRAGRPVILDNARDYALDRNAQSGSVGATIVMPLYAHNHVCGALFVDTHRAGRWHDAAVNACRRIASAISQCLNAVMSVQAPPPSKSEGSATPEQHAMAIAAIKNRLTMGMLNETVKEVIERELEPVLQGKVILHIGEAASDAIVAEAARGRTMVKRQEGVNTRVLLPLATDHMRLGVIDVVLSSKTNFTAMHVKTLETAGTYATRALATAADAPQYS